MRKLLDDDRNIHPFEVVLFKIARLACVIYEGKKCCGKIRKIFLKICDSFAGVNIKRCDETAILFFKVISKKNTQIKSEKFAEHS